MPFRGGVPRKVCVDCGYPMDWSVDGRRIAYWHGAPIRWSTIDIETGERAVLIEHPSGRDIFAVRYSPHGTWVLFHVAGPATTASYVALVRGLKAAGEAEWVRIDDGDAEPHGWWSADGNLLYFLSRREGSVCVYARRLDPATKRPIGPAFDVYHVHGPGLSISVADFGSLAGTRLIFSMNSSSGSIWMGVPE